MGEPTTSTSSPSHTTQSQAPDAGATLAKAITVSEEEDLQIYGAELEEDDTSQESGCGLAASTTSSATNGASNSNGVLDGDSAMQWHSSDGGRGESKKEDDDSEVKSENSVVRVLLHLTLNNFVSYIYQFFDHEKIPQKLGGYCVFDMLTVISAKESFPQPAFLFK